MDIENNKTVIFEVAASHKVRELQEKANFLKVLGQWCKVCRVHEKKKKSQEHLNALYIGNAIAREPVSAFALSCAPFFHGCVRGPVHIASSFTTCHLRSRDITSLQTMGITQPGDISSVQPMGKFYDQRDIFSPMRLLVLSH